MLNNLYQKPAGVQTRWTSFENPTGAAGNGAKENGGAKGFAFKGIAAGEAVTLLDVKGSGVIRRMWMTITDRSPEMLRSLHLDMYWDGCEKPAVSAPLGDFFCAALGLPVAFESALFANPEGRSFNCFIPMPFYRSARIVLTNRSATPLKHLFYDINYTLEPLAADEALYFHAFWNRENPVALGKEYTVLPTLAGIGRFLGVCFGVNAAEAYGTAWFGEGEMKFYLDGDDAHPTLCGTGTEDYIGTAWGQGTYAHMTQGCLVADDDAHKYVFYRFHTVDPIVFSQSLRVTMQDIGGCSRDVLLACAERGAPYHIVSHDVADAAFTPLYLTDFKLTSDEKDGWYNFFRQDDFSSTAYFYYDKPCTELPAKDPLA